MRNTPKRLVWSWTALLLLVLLNSAAIAHEARPCYLEVTETSPGQYAVLWRTPMLAGMRLPVMLKLPDGVRDLKDPMVEELSDSMVERRWITAGANGLAGQRIAFPGLQSTITDVLVRVKLLDGRAWSVIVHPSQAYIEIAAPQGYLAVDGGLHRPRYSPHFLGRRSPAISSRSAADRA